MFSSMKRTGSVYNSECERVCNEEEDLALLQPIGTNDDNNGNEDNIVASTPVPQLKKRKIQDPSPTKVVDEIQAVVKGYSSYVGYLDLLKRTESNVVTDLDMEKQQYITTAMRAILVDWMSELCYNFSLHRATYHLAVNYLDRYIASNCCIKKSEFQTIGAVCVVIATKYYEPVSVSLDMIVQSTGNSCSKSQLVQTENAIVKTLEWHLMVGTMANWVLLFLQRLGDAPFDMYYRCMDLCDRLLLDVHYSHFSSCDISLAVVSAFCCENTDLQLKLKRLLEEFSLSQECVKWVLDIGLSAPSHPLLQLLDSPDGEKTKSIIQTKREMYMEFNFIQPYNQFSLSHYSSLVSN